MNLYTAPGRRGKGLTQSHQPARPDAIRLGGLSEALMAESNGTIIKETRQVLEQILLIEPNNPRAKFYLALGMEQVGNTADARAAFEEIASDSPSDAPWLPLVNEHIGINGCSHAGDIESAGGPRQEDVAAPETGVDGPDADGSWHGS